MRVLSELDDVFLTLYVVGRNKRAHQFYATKRWAKSMWWSMLGDDLRWLILRYEVGALQHMMVDEFGVQVESLEWEVAA